ncbi:MAG: COX15/CtaA family protein [Bacteroidota bacterium]
MNSELLKSDVKKNDVRPWYHRLSRLPFCKDDAIGRAVKVWLAIGLVMIFVQVVVGGITRLTGSGLSITKWEIVTGTLPPMNAAQWEHEFDLYKATPQYKKINSLQGMGMSEFKFIYFWEYIHRLWARTMGFVFLFPFMFFWWRGMFSKELVKRLSVVFLLAALVASFGWIMVKSGLIDRPWVNAYKLTIHLSLALTLYSYLLWTTFRAFQPKQSVIHSPVLRKWGTALLGVTAIQIILGGIMSGMKAGVFYPTWPDMNGVFLPAVLFDGAEWNVNNFVDYDANPFTNGLIQALHRNTAYLLTIMVLWYAFKVFKNIKNQRLRLSTLLLVSMLVIQVLLGIFTIINCKGIVPVGLGVFHQAGALVLLSILLYNRYLLRSST